MKLKNKDMNTNTDVIYRDEKKMHNVPALVIYTMPIVMIVMAVFGIIFLYRLCFKQTFDTDSIVYLSIIAIGLIYGVFVDCFFNFYYNCRYEFGANGNIVYKYDLNTSVMASSDCTVVIKLNRIDKIRKKGKKVLLYGDFEIKRPRQNKKTINKVEILTNFGEYKPIIFTKLSELQERTNNNV